MKRTLIHNATIVNEGRSVQGSVVIEGDRIAEVLTYGKKLSVPCDETIDATGCCLLPGVIDDHVHFRDPGLTHKADILTVRTDGFFSKPLIASTLGWAAYRCCSSVIVIITGAKLLNNP